MCGNGGIDPLTLNFGTTCMSELVFMRLMFAQRARCLGWWVGRATRSGRCDYALRLDTCTLLALKSWWCNGCSRLASANKYYKRVSFSFGLVLCPPRLLASTSVRLAHGDVIAREEPNPTYNLDSFFTNIIWDLLGAVVSLFIKHETCPSTSCSRYVQR